MNIGIDLDDVLANTLPSLVDYHNKTHKTSLTKDDYHSFRLWEVWGCTEEEAIKKVYDFFKTPYFKKIKPLPDSQKAINLLKEKNELYIITSRSKMISKETKIWIEKYFPGAFKEIFFTDTWDKSCLNKDKDEVCNLLKVDIFIDDSLENALACFNEKRKVFLFESPSNKNKKVKKEIYRVKSWEEILEILNSAI